jgi:hypothetical protein
MTVTYEKKRPDCLMDLLRLALLLPGFDPAPVVFRKG